VKFWATFVEKNLLANLLNFTKSGHTVCYDGLRSTKEALKLKKRRSVFGKGRNKERKDKRK